MSQTSVSFHEDLRSGRVSIAEDEPAKVAAAASASSESLLQELEIELQEKMSQMRALADRLALRLDSSFQCELLKLPKAVRTMTMRDFCVQYGGDVDEAIKQQAKRARASVGRDTALMPPPPPMAIGGGAPPTGGRTTRGGRGGSAVPKPGTARKGASRASERGLSIGPVATPAGGARSTRARMQVASTPSAGMTTPMAGGGGAAAMAFTPRMHETPRVMQRGEVALSANGSPINLIDTVRARAGKRGRTGAPPSVLLTMADGSEMDLGDTSAREALANDEARATALDQLQTLQAQVEAHIKALQAGNVQETLGGHIM